MSGGLLTAEAGLSALRAISEPTRLRILMLLAAGEWSVKDLTRILGQSQPRLSRHLKLMHDAGLLSRVQEGSWVYFRITDEDAHRKLLLSMLDRFDTNSDPFRRDRERAEAIDQERAERAQEFFAKHADQWDRLRAMHADEAEVERRMQELLGEEPAGLLVDLGTGTGRIVELLAARHKRVIGIDLSPQMLAYARARTQGRDFAHVQIRQGDLCNLGLPDHSADTVIMHQVLHYLSEPTRAIDEAARLLNPGGRLLIVDFAAHTLDCMRDEFAHQRLGFTNDQITAWLEQAGLSLITHEDLPPAHNADEGLIVSFWLAGMAPSTTVSGKQTVLEVA